MKNFINKPILSLLNRYFIKSKIGPIISIFLPLFMLIIYFVIGNSNGRSNFVIKSLPSVFSFTVLPLFLVTLPTMLIEFRNSIILRKIKTININKFQFNFLVLFFYITYSILFLIINLCFFILFNIKEIQALKRINWATAITGIILLVISSGCFGLFLGNTIKTNLSCQLVGFSIMLITLVFSGQFIPLQVIGTVDIIKYISLFSPLSYSSSIINIATEWNSTLEFPNLPQPSNSLFDFTEDFYIYSFSRAEPGRVIKSVIYFSWQKILFFIFPFIFSTLFFGLQTIFFKWSNR